MKKHLWKHKRLLNELLKRDTGKSQNKIANKIVGYVFLALLNFLMMCFIGFFTLDSFASFNSRIGGLVISLLLPLVIASLTTKMNRLERLLKFGTGLIIYLLIGVFYVGFPFVMTTFLLPCLVLALFVLYYGDVLYKLRIVEEEDELV